MVVGDDLEVLYREWRYLSKIADDVTQIFSQKNDVYFKELDYCCEFFSVLEFVGYEEVTIEIIMSSKQLVEVVNSVFFGLLGE